MGKQSTRVFKYHYRDHDTDVVDVAPPIQNQWYTAFDAEDVRLIWCTLNQSNDEINVKTVQMRWTIDGTVYMEELILTNNVMVWLYRDIYPSALVGISLGFQTFAQNAGCYVDKRGHSFKVEVRIISAPGTDQTLTCYCVRETLERT